MDSANNARKNGVQDGDGGHLTTQPKRTYHWCVYVEMPMINVAAQDCDDVLDGGIDAHKQ